MTLNEAVDLYLGDIARRHTPATLRKYRQVLGYLQDDLSHRSLDDISRDDIERWLNRWQTRSKTTMALHTSIVKCFFRYLVKRGTLDVSPAENIDRPKLPKPEDRDVVTVSWQDVEKMIGHCETWQETITFGLLAYLGPRRNALSKLRWRDVDLDNHRIRFFEKGNKASTKVMERGLLDLFRAYHGALTEGGTSSPRGETAGDGPRSLLGTLTPPSVSAPDPDTYVIPNSHPNKVRRQERDNRIVWDIVRRVAKRAGIHATTHSLRRAFAVHMLEEYPERQKAVQFILGHDRPETTQLYQKLADREKVMETNKDLDWGFTFGALSEGASSETLPDAVGGMAEASATGLAPASSLSALTLAEGESAGLRAGEDMPLPSGRTASSEPSASVSASSEPRVPSPPTGSPVGSGVLRAARSTSSASLERPRDVARVVPPGDLPGEQGHRTMAPASFSSRQHAPGERLAAHHVFPSEPEEAHTGFEPVFCDDVDSIGIGRLPTVVGEGNGRLPDGYLDMFLASLIRSDVVDLYKEALR